MKMLVILVAALAAVAFGQAPFAQSYLGYNVFGAGGTTLIVLGLIAAFMIGIALFGVVTGKFFAGDRLGSWRRQDSLTKQVLMMSFAMFAAGARRLHDMFADPFTPARRFRNLKLGAA